METSLLTAPTLPPITRSQPHARSTAPTAVRRTQRNSQSAGRQPAGQADPPAPQVVLNGLQPGRSGQELPLPLEHTPGIRLEQPAAFHPYVIGRKDSTMRDECGPRWLIGNRPARVIVLHGAN